MSEQKSKAKHSALIAIPIVIIAVSLAVTFGVIYLAYHPELLPTPTVSDELSQSSSQEQESEELQKEDIVYLDHCVFVGDSRTRAMDLYGYLDITQTLAEDGINHKTALTKAFADLGDGHLYTLYQGLRLTDPRFIYVGFGINGMNFIPEEEFFDTYRQLIGQVREACPKAKIAILAIYPVGETFSQNNPGMSNADIDTYNEKLKALAKQLDVSFVDAASALKNEANALDPRYAAADGLHLKASAYEVIFDVILSEKMD